MRKELPVAPQIPSVPDQQKEDIDWERFGNSITKSKSKPNGSVFEKREEVAIKYLVDTFFEEGYTDIRLLAYALATVRRECGSNMLPVREGFAKTDKAARAHVRKYKRRYAKEINGQVYYGRGYVQLTWDYNYKKEGIEHNPDKALEPEFAAKLLFKGLLDGRWNGKAKGLMYYLDRNDPVQARRTVNVLDHAELIAGYYRDYLAALEASLP